MVRTGRVVGEALKSSSLYEFLCISILRVFGGRGRWIGKVLVVSTLVKIEGWRNDFDAAAAKWITFGFFDFRDKTIFKIHREPTRFDFYVDDTLYKVSVAIVTCGGLRNVFVKDVF